MVAGARSGDQDVAKLYSQCQAVRIHHLFLLCMHGFGPAQLWQRIHINSAGPFMEKTFILVRFMLTPSDLRCMR